VPGWSSPTEKFRKFNGSLAYDGAFVQPLPCPPNVTYCVKGAGGGGGGGGRGGGDGGVGGAETLARTELRLERGREPTLESTQSKHRHATENTQPPPQQHNNQQ
jgi:hypothetical protein